MLEESCKEKERKKRELLYKVVYWGFILFIAGATYYLCHIRHYTDNANDIGMFHAWLTGSFTGIG